MTGRHDVAPARDGGFTTPASPRDRTTFWLIVWTIAGLAILTWPACADTRAPDPPPLRSTIHPAWIPAPLHREQDLARLEQPEERP